MSKKKNPAAIRSLRLERRLIEIRAVIPHHDKKIIISADTIVVLGKRILNKPRSLNEAVRFLESLSGRTHIVYTGINVINLLTGIEKFGYEKTAVEFRKLSREEIKFYVRKYKPLDKAGAYGIQDDFGCLFIKRIKGDYYNVVGLPLVKLYELIQETIR